LADFFCDSHEGLLDLKSDEKISKAPQFSTTSASLESLRHGSGSGGNQDGLLVNS
jgi:hypothetical protein